MTETSRQVVLHIGFDKSVHEKIKTAALNAHQKTTEFCRHAITILSETDEFLRLSLLTFADSLGVPPGYALGAILAYYFAQRNATETVWGTVTVNTEIDEVVAQGRLGRGQPLLSLLQQHFTRQYEADRERAILFDHYIHGRLPTQAETAFVRSRGPLTREEDCLREQLARCHHRQERLQELEMLGYDLQGFAPWHRRILISLYQQVKAGGISQADFDEALRLAAKDIDGTS